MLITKFTHACVRVEDAGRVLVIDPGVWSEPDALDGADGVLVTHEHADHVDVLRLAGLGAPVYAPVGANVGGSLDVHRIQPGGTFTAAGFTVRALGGRHAPWLKLTEAIDFVRRIGPKRAYGIHDGMINDRGLASINGWLVQETSSYRWLAPGETAVSGTAGA